VGSLEVRLYGRLRRYAGGEDPREETLVRLPLVEGETLEGALGRVGIDARQEVSHLFVNGSLCRDWSRTPREGDRLGVFPKDMGLLYV
jgi:hypothetical protein